MTRAAVTATLLGTLMLVAPAGARGEDPLRDVRLPADWEQRFHQSEEARALAGMTPAQVVALVPVQAGLRFARCPGCGADDEPDPLAWSLLKPDVVTCRRCAAVFPNEKVPAKGGDGKLPEDTVEVRPGTIHRYPYHVLEPERQHYAEERVYVAAKRDYEAREWLAKAAMYFAARSRSEQGGDGESPSGRIAALLVLRFAQVYRDYAVHYDQPGEPKFFQRADPAPPFRRGYRSAKWDWNGAQDVPLNLVLAYAIVRGTPAMADAGRVLGDPNPERTIESRLMRASARFVLEQSDDSSEMSLYAVRGVLAVGRLLNDPELVHRAVARLDAFASRAFHHDGMLRGADPVSHRRMLALLDGWIERLLVGYSDPSGFRPADGRRFERLPGAGVVPMIQLARSVDSTTMLDPHAADVRQASWPVPEPRGTIRRPQLLGGAGLARLAVGEGDGALDLELRGGGEEPTGVAPRMTLRVVVAGKPVLGDLDDLPARRDGWERSTAAHGTIAVDGLNQREAVSAIGRGAPGADVLFYAADPDFQVAVFDDRFAYPRSASMYRRTVVACESRAGRYAVEVFTVIGGLQHDQFHHASPGSPARWETNLAHAAGPRSLLPPGMTFLPEARADGGRWFVQSYGHFADIHTADADGPAQARLVHQGLGVRLHLMNEGPQRLMVAETSDDTPGAVDGRRASLIVRRRSVDGATLRSRFVMVYDPVVGGLPSLVRVGRVAAPEGTVVLTLRVGDQDEHIVVRDGTDETSDVRLADGRSVKTDGTAVRIIGDAVTLAGGTFAEVGGSVVRQERIGGRIVAAGPGAKVGRGRFRTDAAIPQPSSVQGRALLVRRPDGSARGWTIADVQEEGTAGATISLAEAPGLATVNGGAGPDGMRPVDGRHEFVIGRIGRSGAGGPVGAAPRRGGTGGVDGSRRR